MASLVLELRNKTALSMTARDWQALERLVGARVLLNFVVCFILADRVTSLIEFVQPATKRQDAASDRDFVSFYVFLFGTLWELGEKLEDLSKALEDRRLLDSRHWKRTLGRWTALMKSDHARHIRNKVCFHLDPHLVREGIAQATKRGRVLLLQSHGRKERDGHYVLGTEAVFKGLGKRVGDIRRFLHGPARRLDIQRALQAEFLRVMADRRVKVLKVRTKGPSMPPLQQERHDD